MRSHFKVVALFTLLSLAASGGARAQNQPAPIAASAESAAAPSFEVSTVKLDTLGDRGSSTGLSRNSDLFKATNVTIKGLLRFEAFHIADARIVGGPKWIDSARFDIEAKLDPADASYLNSLAPAEKNAMEEALIQKLLADRFQLKTHWEDREQPVYLLVVAKGGPKMQAAAEAKHGSGYSLSFGKLWGTDVTLVRVADMLTQGASDELGRVVVDRTGIAGSFDFNLKWTPETGVASADASSAAVSGPSLFTAIQEQLGLKLEPGKAPVRVLVIDRLEMPSEN